MSNMQSARVDELNILSVGRRTEKEENFEPSPVYAKCLERKRPAIVILFFFLSLGRKRGKNSPWLPMCVYMYTEGEEEREM